MKDSKLPAFIMGMVALLVILGLLVVIGPGIIPAQLDRCWIELQRAQPNCATRVQDGATFIRDLRCIRAGEGITLGSLGTTGWWRVGQVQAPATPAPAP